MELGLASHAVLAVEDSRSLVSPGALLVIDLPGCFSPQMVPTCPSVGEEDEREREKEGEEGEREERGEGGAPERGEGGAPVPRGAAPRSSQRLPRTSFPSVPRVMA